MSALQWAGVAALLTPFAGTLVVAGIVHGKEFALKLLRDVFFAVAFFAVAIGWAAGTAYMLSGGSL